MPVEIRELVIQAKVEENMDGTQNGGEEHSGTSNIPPEEIAALIDSEINESFSSMKNSIMQEMKRWMKDYLKDEKNGF